MIKQKEVKLIMNTKALVWNVKGYSWDLTMKYLGASRFSLLVDLCVLCRPLLLLLDCCCRYIAYSWTVFTHNKQLTLTSNLVRRWPTHHGILTCTQRSFRLHMSLNTETTHSSRKWRNRWRKAGSRPRGGWASSQSKDVMRQHPMKQNKIGMTNSNYM